MKEAIKAFYILAFLGIMIPSDKLTIPNGGLLLLMLLQSVNSIFIEEMNLEIFTYLIMSLITSIGLTFILIEKKLYNLIGIILQFIWLGYLLSQNKWEDLKDTLLLVTISIYLLMTLTLIFQLYCNKKKAINSK